jgi:hypothetical protein
MKPSIEPGLYIKEKATLYELLCEASRERDSLKLAQLVDEILARLAKGEKPEESPLYRL